LGSKRDPQFPVGDFQIRRAGQGRLDERPAFIVSSPVMRRDPSQQVTFRLIGQLGRYSFPRSTVVSTVWEFDTSNRLVDVLVIKASDAP